MRTSYGQKLKMINQSLNNPRLPHLLTRKPQEQPPLVLQHNPVQQRAQQRTVPKAQQHKTHQPPLPPQQPPRTYRKEPTILTQVSSPCQVANSLIQRTVASSILRQE